jgi:para-nitrobenzyl esterase
MQPYEDTLHQGGTEDCLYLDIYAPPANVTPKAVMFWIHGGCYINGNLTYSGEALVETGDVIVVVVSYRMGVFGFLGAD